MLHERTLIQVGLIKVTASRPMLNVRQISTAPKGIVFIERMNQSSTKSSVVFTVHPI